MRVVDYTPKFGKGQDKLTMVWTGDWHLGCGSESRSTIDLLINKIRKNKLLWMHGGDVMDAILPKDKRADIQTAQSTIMEQMEETVKILKPIAETGVGLMSGNHEQSVSKDFGSVTGHICQQLGIQSLTATCFVRFKFPGKEMVAFATHFVNSLTFKAGEPERRDANRVVRLREATSHFQADLKLLAHIHHFVCTPPVYVKRLAPVGDEVKRMSFLARESWHMTCPSMMKVYTSIPNYAEMRLMEPTDIGWAELDMDKDGRISETRYMGHKGQVIKTVVEEQIE